MLRNKLVAGALAGLVGGLAFGVMMQMMSAPTPDGGRMPMLGMVAMVVGAEGVGAGWIYHLFNSAVIGAIFGLLLGGWSRGYGSGTFLGAVYGATWWVLGGLILMPIALDMAAFAPLTMMTSVAMGSLIGHVIFGVLLGAAFVALYRSSARSAETGVASGASRPA